MIIIQLRIMIHQYNENKQSSILNYKQQEKDIQKNLEDICYV